MLDQDPGTQLCLVSHFTSPVQQLPCLVTPWPPFPSSSFCQMQSLVTSVLWQGAELSQLSPCHPGKPGCPVSLAAAGSGEGSGPGSCSLSPSALPGLQRHQPGLSQGRSKEKPLCLIEQCSLLSSLICSGEKAWQKPPAGWM